MKQLNILLFLTLPLFSLAQVRFEKSGLEASFQKAEQLNRPVFLMIYADGCPHCEHYMRTLETNKVIGTFYNEHFVNCRVEVNSEEGLKFRRERNIYVMSTPLITFWSADRLLDLIPAGDEQNNETDIIDFGRKALHPGTQWTATKQHFKAGFSEPDFLLTVAYKARYTCDTSINMEAMRRYASWLESQNFKDDGFLPLQKVVIDDENPLFMHVFNNRSSYYDRYGEKTVNQTLENILMFSLYSSRAAGFSGSKTLFMKEALRKLKVSERSIAGRFLIPETRAMLSKGDLKPAVRQIADFYAGQDRINKEEANYIKKYLLTYTDDAELLAPVQWILKQAD